MPLGGRPCPQCDETHRGCPRRAPGASRGTARENRGPWRAWEAGCPVRARAEITGKYAGEVREGVRGRTRGGCRRGVCSVTGWSREGARRRLVAAAGRPPGRGRPEPGGRARKYSYDALKILQRVWAASGGVVAVSTSRSPCRCCWTCWRGPVSSTASPATNPAVRAGPGGHERGDHRPLSRPGRGPRRARPVHDEGRSPAAQLHQDPQGQRARWRPSPGLFEARHRHPLRSGARSGEFARTVNMEGYSAGVHVHFRETIL